MLRPAAVVSPSGRRCSTVVTPIRVLRCAAPGRAFASITLAATFTGPYSGIAFGLAEACGGLEPSEVVATGGMLRNDLFSTILADVLERPVARLRETDTAAALGAAFADVPERVAALIPTAATIEPSGADYEEVGSGISGRASGS